MWLFITTVAMVLSAGPMSARANTDAEIERVVSDMIRQKLPTDGIAGAAVAVHIGVPHPVSQFWHGRRRPADDLRQTER
jgi:hypothetical protein